MLRDSLPSHQLPKPDDLSVPVSHEIEQILFLWTNIYRPFHHTTGKITNRQWRIGLRIY